MKKIYLVPNANKDKDLKVTWAVVERLRSHGAAVSLPIELSGKIPDCSYTDTPEPDTELVIVIGGDGSFIDASNYALSLDVPMLGINLGKLGYLSEVEPDDLSALDSVFTGEYKIVEKMLLECVCISDGKELRSERLAVNDVVVSHSSYLGIADFTVRSRDGSVGYRADGVVISTPAGSTAYSLSVGGPIVSHSADSLIVTPIAPHSFFNRSLIFGSRETVSVECNADAPLNVSVDGRHFFTLTRDDICTVFSSEKRLKVLTFTNNNMLSVLFNKMRTVEDII